MAERNRSDPRYLFRCRTLVVAIIRMSPTINGEKTDPATMTSNSVATSGRKTVPDDAHRDLIVGVAYDPIFIMGEHRSGTTVLYKLLDLTRAFNCVLAYHVACYDELLTNHVAGRTDEAIAAFSREMQSRGIETSTLDRMRGQASSPVECWPILRRRGTMRIKPKSLPVFDEMCRKIQVIADAPRPILIKNPADYPHFMDIKALFPAAKFIFIHRHPIHTMDSMLRAPRRSWTQANPYTQLISPQYVRLQKNRLFSGLIQRIFAPNSRLQRARRAMAGRISRNARYYMDHIGRLGQSDYISLRYEDLCAKPNETIAEILGFLGRTPEVVNDFSELIQARDVELLPELARVEGQLKERFAPIMAHNGYT